MKTGEELAKAKEIMAQSEVDLSQLDKAVDGLIAKLLHTFPNCMNKTISEVRKFKLEHWDKNKEGSREWLALNMMTEAKSGFRAFNDGPKENREVDFILLRKLLAEGQPWTEELHQAISPQFKAQSA
jgi:6-oxo-cyclohex-1-ene-carbonyl-CoA hydrolase